MWSVFKQQQQHLIDRGIVMDKVELTNLLINKFQYKNYLEIGCESDNNFRQIIIETKIGVDPVSGGTHRMTSDDFFVENKIMFDIVLIDGLHISDQADKDIINSIRFLNNNGTIIMHDCCPVSEEDQRQQRVHDTWNGDVWKSFVKQRANPNIDSATGNFDWGCGVLRVRLNSEILVVNTEDLHWNNLVKNRKQWLRLMEETELLKWI